MLTYRKSLWVWLLFAVPALLVGGLVFVGLFLYVETQDGAVLSSDVYGVVAIIIVFLVLGYTYFHTSIKIMICEEMITIKRFFMVKYSGALRETEIRSFTSTSTKLFKPSTILLFVRAETDLVETKIRASGLGVSRMERVFNQNFNNGVMSGDTVLKTIKPETASRRKK